MKLLLPIFFILPLISFGQKNWNFALEGQISMLNKYYDFNSLSRGLNLDLQYKNYEIYFGYNQSNVSSFYLHNKGYSVIGPNGGFKYHLASFSNRKSHFFTDLNIQWRKYFLNSGTPPLGGNSTVNEIYDTKLMKINSTNFHLGLGYEIYLTKSMSIPCIASIGMVKHAGEVTSFGVTRGYSDIDKWEFSPLIQFALRVYLFKAFD